MNAIYLAMLAKFYKDMFGMTTPKTPVKDDSNV